MDQAEPYPAYLDIDYPDRELNWVTSFFRPIVVIPIAIVLGLVSGPAIQKEGAERPLAAGGTIFLAVMLMLVFRRKYPRWWFDWNLELVRFSTRVAAYLALLRDEYPSTDEEQAVHIDILYPDAQELNRWLPLVKWLLAIPHYIVMALLLVGVVFCVIIAWFAILLTGRYPRPLFDYVVGVFRWWLRVAAYAFLLTTDRYPPFRLSD
jgi:uncharacterized protein DUF4389